MATRQYIGARYVPKFYENSVDGSTQWESNVVYDPLVYVTLQNGHMYISKKQVPATVGSPASNVAYWLDMGSYNGFIDSLQNQINVLDTEVDDLQYLKAGYTNVISLGVKNDGSEDCSTIINNNADKPLYFPAGIYRFDSTINLKNNVQGDGYPSSWKLNHFDGTVFNFTMVDGSNGIEYSGNVNELSIDIGNISIQMAGTGNAINLTTTNTHFYIHDVSMLNVKGTGLYAAPTNLSSIYVRLKNVTVWGVYANPTIGSVGIECGSNAVDCVFEQCFLLGVQKGIVLRGGNCKIIGGQCWCAGGTNSAEYYNNTVCIDLYATGLIISNFYFDSALVLLHCGPIGKAVTINNCNVYWGAYESLRNFAAPTFFSLANNKTLVYINEFFVEMPFTTFYISNVVENIVGAPIINGIGDYTSPTNIGRLIKTDRAPRYRGYIDVSNGQYAEVARIGKYSSALINVGNWLMLVTGRGDNSVEFIKIGTGLSVFFKEEQYDYKIYVYAPSNWEYEVTGLTIGVVNPEHNLFNGERMSFDQQSDQTGLTAATEKQWINT